jgi:hypothetical protein
VFKRHLRNLRMLVSLDPMASAEVWNAAARKCWPRELEDLKTYGARMRENVMRDFRPKADAQGPAGSGSTAVS